jgi:hypothetical protein
MIAFLLFIIIAILCWPVAVGMLGAFGWLVYTLAPIIIGFFAICIIAGVVAGVLYPEAFKE